MSRTTRTEQAVIEAAGATRDMCVCQESESGEPCDGPVPLTRVQAVRLRAYAAQHPERAIIYAELEGQWMAALHAHLPSGPDPVEQWLRDPWNLPAEADLRHSPDAGELLDILGAGPAAEMS